MPYELFDRSKLNIKPLNERIHDTSIDVFIGIDEALPHYDNPALEPLAGSILAARDKGASIIMMYGAHVIRTGCALHMIEMMKRGQLTHLATNGAGAIHDFELSMIGKTCEDVAHYIEEGQFGLWHETGRINDIVAEGCRDGIGFGESIGRYIRENNLPYKEKSVLGMAYKLGIPCTVHVGIGSDIVHEHPNFDGALTGEATYTDFLIYTHSVSNLEGGVFMNVGSAVTGPEVYLKALSMARNAAKQSGKKIVDFTTAVFDIQQLDEKNSCSAPQKSDPRYYFRPWKTVLDRTVAGGGKSYYIRGEHRLTIPHLARRLWDLEAK